MNFLILIVMSVLEIVMMIRDTPLNLADKDIVLVMKQNITIVMGKEDQEVHVHITTTITILKPCVLRVVVGISEREFQLSQMGSWGNAWQKMKGFQSN